MEVTIFWFRRDLRLEDNAGLYAALKENQAVLSLFIFDKNILDKLDDKNDLRINFIFFALKKLYDKLKDLGTSIIIKYGYPIEVWKQLIQEYNIKNVYTNHDYEPYAIERDNTIAKLLKSFNIEFKTYKDQCIFEKNEILNDYQKPYTVFTHYSRKWKNKLEAFYYKAYPTLKYVNSFIKINPQPFPKPADIGFHFIRKDFQPAELDETIIRNYGQKRNYPAIQSTTRIGVHLRFGTISIRKCVSKAVELQADSWLNELIWRDFFMMILWHFPFVTHSAFKKEYDNIEWRNNVEEFEKWCAGKTGYPLVDAGMRELNETGFMHNRVRMVTASFLVKHLLIDWRWGEAYFAKKLLDYDLAANNGGWQWAAGCGCDAAPYFRIFNPTLQTKKFDPKGEYIRKWIQEFDTLNYPQPIVEHSYARQRVLNIFKKVLK
jgi:deoxyribodipyrimidine photo-lyase